MSEIFFWTSRYKKKCMSWYWIEDDEVGLNILDDYSDKVLFRQCFQEVKMQSNIYFVSVLLAKNERGQFEQTRRICQKTRSYEKR